MAKRHRPIPEVYLTRLGTGWRNTDVDESEVRCCFPFRGATCLPAVIEGIKAENERRDDGPRGLGDFQRRLNRDRPNDYRRNDRDRGYNHDRDRRGWDATPRSERGGRGDDAPSVRVPNIGWDATPRRQSSPSATPMRNRRWDAPTPRRRSPVDGENGDGLAGMGLDAHEWEEEQIRLDRDWYMGAEEGGVAGDEEFNPLAQYEDLGAKRQAEAAAKQTKKISAKQAQYVSGIASHSEIVRLTPDLDVERR